MKREASYASAVSVMVGRERDGPLRLGSHAVVVHEAHDPHREALGG